MKKIFSLFLVLCSTVIFAQETFSDASLQKFANAYNAIRVESNLMQLNMISEIEKAGLTNDQFTTIHMKLNDTAKSSEVSNEEKKKYITALENIKSFEKDSQKSFQSIIEDNGLTLETYQAISKACNEDKALNTQVMSYVNK